ncbi:hypothetical protein ETQ85_14740 [Zoogloea oleivorans]|uniref:Uncharacterized protein n=1 Tax=Zoogloea oleivorans TaxID=1552750 RepID=A0A6C2CNX2_9RHOO|nr:hypothetical protein [Zoogloea oleivorans]TYC55269.1 hypothetical protein ETQ85_14740 [Zoogloea oleivorans]
MHQPKVEKSALYMILPMIRELKSLGFANVRFYSYLRWVQTLMVVLYQEMPFKARTGEALVYPNLFRCEYGFDMAPKFISEREPDLNEWAGSGLSVQEIAAKFSELYLCDQQPGEGCYSEEYYPWLDSVMDICPTQAFPVTEEPVPGGPYNFGETIEFYGADEAHRESDIRRPPGLNKMLVPQQAMESAIAWDIARAKAREPSRFKMWNQKHTNSNK